MLIDTQRGYTPRAGQDAPPLSESDHFLCGLNAPVAAHNATQSRRHGMEKATICVECYFSNELQFDGKDFGQLLEIKQ